MDMFQVLQGAISPDPAIRHQSEALLNEALVNQYGPLLLALCGEFAKESNTPDSRQLVGIHIKNIMTATDNRLLEEKVNRWLGCDIAFKEQIRLGFLHALHSDVPIVRHTAAQIIAAFGAIDLPRQEWKNLVKQLLDNTSDPNTSAGTKTSSLEALGYLCEELEENCLPPAEVNGILTVIIQGMAAANPDEIRIVSLKALLNSLDFTHQNFEQEQESDIIVKNICEATQRSNKEEKKIAFECMVRIADCHYERLPRYMQTLYQLTSTAILSEDEEIAIQALNFWESITTIEIDIKEDLSNGIDDTVMHNITTIYSQPLVPILLESLTKRNENGDDENDLSNIAALVLDMISTIIESAIIPLTLPFVHQNINNPNWHYKNAAITTFGLILDGPAEGEMSNYVVQALPFLLPCLVDPSPRIRDSTLWTFGRIFDSYMTCIDPHLLPEIMRLVHSLLSDSDSHVAYQACLGIFNFASSCAYDEQPSTNNLSPYMSTLIQGLITVAYSNEDEIRNQAYEAINMLIENSAADMTELVTFLLQDSANRLDTTFTASGSGRDIQGFLCVLIGICVQKLGSEKLAAGVATIDQVIVSFLRILGSKGALAQEDTLMALGNVIGTLEMGYMRYVDRTIAPILSNLKDVEETSIVIWSIGVVGDLCRSLNTNLIPYIDDIMTCLVQILESPLIDRTVKPPALSIFADISMAIGERVENYMPHMLMYLEQAAQLEASNDDDKEYINAVRSSICESYTGIIQGLQGTSKIHIFEPYIPQIRAFINVIQRSDYNSDELYLQASSLVGDLGQVYKLKMAQIFHEDHVLQLLQATKETITEGDDTSLKQYMWAASIVNGVMKGQINWN